MRSVGISTEVNLDHWRLSLGRVSASMVLGGFSILPSQSPGNPISNPDVTQRRLPRPFGKGGNHRNATDPERPELMADGTSAITALGDSGSF